MSYRYESFGLSDPGLVRSNNEDFWGGYPERGFWVLADGMGGCQAGEVASRTTVEYLVDFVKKIFVVPREVSLAEATRKLHSGLLRVNRLIWQKGRQNTEYLGMGTTVCCLWFIEQQFLLGHVGDSRAYCLRRGKLLHLSTDDTVSVPLKGSKNASLKRVLTRAIGIQADVIPNIHGDHVEEEDLYMLCSDGLTDMVQEPHIRATLAGPGSLKDKAHSLINQAKKGGGQDNITVILIRVIS